MNAFYFLGWLGLVGGSTRRLTGCERRRTNSSDPCGFESQRPMSVQLGERSVTDRFLAAKAWLASVLGR